MTTTDTQLKFALAKMLPEILEFVPLEMDGDIEQEPFLAWRAGDEVLGTELLHLCWLVEETLDYDSTIEYRTRIKRLELLKGPVVMQSDYSLLHASWQERVTALAKVKGIEL